MLSYLSSLCYHNGNMSCTLKGTRRLFTERKIFNIASKRVPFHTNNIQYQNRKLIKQKFLKAQKIYAKKIKFA